MSCVSEEERFARIQAKYYSLREEGIDYGGRLSGYIADWLPSDVNESHHGYVKYEEGWICWGNGVHGVHRRFNWAWREALSTLGYPVTTTRPSRYGLGRFNRFEGIVWGQGNYWLVTPGGNWSDIFIGVPDDLHTTWKFYDDSWTVVLLTDRESEKLMLRQDIDIQPPATDFSKYIVAILLGSLSSGSPMPVSVYADKDGLYFGVQIIERDDGAFYPAVMTDLCWVVDIPRTLFDQGFPGEVRLEGKVRKIPGWFPPIESYE